MDQDLTSQQVDSRRAQRSRGLRARRHHRAWPSWWTSLLRSPTTEVTTVWQLARRLEREAAWAEKERCRRAWALRQRHQLPIERIAVPIIRGPVWR